MTQSDESGKIARHAAGREPPRPLIPQFSIRWMLTVTAGCAVVFSVFGLAIRGSQWAAGVSLAVVSLAVLMLVQAGMFGVVWMWSVLTEPLQRRRVVSGRSPFLSPSAGSPPGALSAAAPSPAAPSGDDPETPATPIVLE
ncbi:MAG: hypothetical protein JXB62_01765 [Pirellulales bacterium]|nr:hypothetical protein [Pirellulales bacterium]